MQGSLFLFARQVRFFERHGPQNQTPRAGGWVKTNYGGVKRQAQWGTEKTARFSVPFDLSCAGQQWESVGQNSVVYTWFEEIYSQMATWQLVFEGRVIACVRMSAINCFLIINNVASGGEMYTCHSNWSELIFIQQQRAMTAQKHSWLSSFQILRCLCETKADRYPSHHPDDHCDRAGLYLEDTRGPLKRESNGYVGIKWRH